MDVSRLSLRSVTTILGGLALILPAIAVSQQESQCVIQIAAPRPASQVGSDEQIKGTARIPADGYLWVFVHVKGLALWWPQGAGPAQLEKGKWEVLAFFGGPQDVGKDFEVAVAALDSDSNNEMLKWYKKADDTHQYPGIRFPTVLKGCPVERVTVTKLR